MPETHGDAMRFQAENLEQATHSRVASRVATRIHSIANSVIASAINSRRASRSMSARGSTATSRRGSIAPGLLKDLQNQHFQQQLETEESPETLENLIRVTQIQDSILQAYYTNDQGEVVTLSLYDISSQDPADFLGNDVIAQTEKEDSNLDFNEAVFEKLKHHHRRRSLQRSGDSYNGNS